MQDFNLFIFIETYLYSSMCYSLNGLYMVEKILWLLNILFYKCKSRIYEIYLLTSVLYNCSIDLWEETVDLPVSPFLSFFLFHVFFSAVCGSTCIYNALSSWYSDLLSLENVFFFETEFYSCCPVWSAMMPSQLTTTSASQVQAILLPQPLK